MLFLFETFNVFRKFILKIFKLFLSFLHIRRSSDSISRVNRWRVLCGGILNVLQIKRVEFFKKYHFWDFFMDEYLSELMIE